MEAVQASRLWHEAQQYRAQAEAASEAASEAGRLLREAALAAGAPPSRSSPARTARTSRTSPAAGRGPITPGAFGGVPPRAPGPPKPGTGKSR
ncbi:hypothetical protein Slala05_75930 [Streptomyces lavendulae subsp. lavendulae]|nr:hypothetical protein Slala05_75930 [Streptomyces lavendulae subsp. lavendulae]